MTNMPGFNAEVVLNIPRGSYHAEMRNVDTEGITPSINWGGLISGVGGTACDLIPDRRARRLCKAGTSIGGGLF